MSIPADLYAQLRHTLLTCWSYESDYQIDAVFLDPRLSPWRHGIPQAGSKAATVDALISYLHDKQHASSGRNALVLLLEVLGEQIDPGDSCAPQMRELGGMLEAALSQQIPAPVAGGAGAPDRMRMLRLLTTYFGEEDLRDLCFYLEDVDFDSLPGRGKNAKARELILYLERRNQLRALQNVGRKVRPDVPWDEANEPA
jgi:hypothetical protein